jgi:hypothetical protein
MFDFPFISMLKGSKSLGLHLYIDPRFYYAEPMTGLLYMFPFVIFAIVPLMIFMSNRYKVNPVQDDNQRSIDWTTLTLGSSFILSFSLFTTYFWAGMRFAADFLPGLTMLSAIGFWQGYSKLRHELPAQNYYRTVGIILAVTSIVISTLLVASTL